MFVVFITFDFKRHTHVFYKRIRIFKLMNIMLMMCYFLNYVCVLFAFLTLEHMMFQTAQETPESQLQVARAVINEYHQPRTSNSSNSSQRQLQQKTLPLKMTVSRTAKRKLDFPAVQNKRRHFFSQCESVKNADDQPYFYSPFSQGTE